MICRSYWRACYVCERSNDFSHPPGSKWSMSVGEARNFLTTQPATVRYIYISKCITTTTRKKEEEVKEVEEEEEEKEKRLSILVSSARAYPSRPLSWASSRRTTVPYYLPGRDSHFHLIPQADTVTLSV